MPTDELHQCSVVLPYVGVGKREGKGYLIGTNLGGKKRVGMRMGKEKRWSLSRLTAHFGKLLEEGAILKEGSRGTG
ncbi:hypothetical protein [Parapedobacter indicus]|uniref:hypothetical protein n=1 Tax=Parapedobacter indicus TaxID=1477437 RepID=UPI000B826761|nr:hypothetical protein [Parapedobacter indicus]